MPAWLRLVGNFFKTFWWIFVLILAVVLFIIGGFVLVQGRKRSQRKKGIAETESFVAAVTHKVQDAVTDIKIEKAVISTKSDMLRGELEKIREEPDGQERRKKLASILQSSL